MSGQPPIGELIESSSSLDRDQVLTITTLVTRTREGAQV